MVLIVSVAELTRIVYASTNFHPEFIIAPALRCDYLYVNENDDNSMEITE